MRKSRSCKNDDKLTLKVRLSREKRSHSTGNWSTALSPSPFLGGGDKEKLLEYLSWRKLFTFLAQSPEVQAGGISDSPPEE